MFSHFVIVHVIFFYLQANSKRPTNVAASMITAHTSFMHSPPTMDTPTLNGTPLATATATIRKFNEVQIFKFDN